VLIGPGFDAAGAGACSRPRPNVRLLEIALTGRRRRPTAHRSTSSASAAGCWCRPPTTTRCAREDLKVVTQRAARRRRSCDDLLFAWTVAQVREVQRHRVLRATACTLGVGAGQMSRVDSAPHRLHQGRPRGAVAVRGSVVASDAFFPFRDGLDVVADAGAACRHPARRLDARRRGDRRRRRARRGHGVHAACGTSATEAGGAGPRSSCRERILGIDPGLQRTGFGVIERRGRARWPTWPAARSARCEAARRPAGAAEDHLRRACARWCDALPAGSASVEIVFVNVNPQSTLLLGQARGAALGARW
jgi:hypothetical protein